MADELESDGQPSRQILPFPKFDAVPNESYAALMREKGIEATPRIKAVLGLS
jgi:hypothetical protein